MNVIIDIRDNETRITRVEKLDQLDMIHDHRIGRVNIAYTDGMRKAISDSKTLSGNDISDVVKQRAIAAMEFMEV